MPIFASPSAADGLTATLRRLVELTGATAGALEFRPRCQEPIVVTASVRRVPAALRDWLTTVTGTPAARPGLTRVAPPGANGPASLLRTPLGTANRPAGELLLLGRVGSLTAAALPADLPHELGAALDHLSEREQRAGRTAALAEISRLLTTRHTIDELFAAFAGGIAQLVAFDSLNLSLLDAERREFELIDVRSEEHTSELQSR